MNYKVREVCTAEELGKVVELRYEILREPWGQPFGSSRDELEDSSINAFIVDDDEQIIACGRLQRNNEHTGQVRYMAVKKNFRSRGLGAQILKHLEKRASETGLKEIELQARENAVKFYTEQGYELVEKTFLLWGIIQHYLMRKSL